MKRPQAESNMDIFNLACLAVNKAYSKYKVQWVIICSRDRWAQDHSTCCESTGTRKQEASVYDTATELQTCCVAARPLSPVTRHLGTTHPKPQGRINGQNYTGVPNKVAIGWRVHASSFIHSVSIPTQPRYMRVRRARSPRPVSGHGPGLMTCSITAGAWPGNTRKAGVMRLCPTGLLQRAAHKIRTAPYLFYLKKFGRMVKLSLAEQQFWDAVSKPISLLPDLVILSKDHFQSVCIHGARARVQAH